MLACGKKETFSYPYTYGMLQMYKVITFNRMPKQFLQPQNVKKYECNKVLLFPLPSVRSENLYYLNNHLYYVWLIAEPKTVFKPIEHQSAGTYPWKWHFLKKDQTLNLFESKFFPCCTGSIVLLAFLEVTIRIPGSQLCFPGLDLTHC